MLPDKTDSHRCHPPKDVVVQIRRRFDNSPLRDSEEILLSMASIFSDETTSTVEEVV